MAGETRNIDIQIKSTWLNMFKMYNQVAARYDTSQIVGMVLLSIAKEGTPSTSIAPMLGMESTSLSRIINALEAEHLIVRKKDNVDGRMVSIFLTKKGVEKRRIAKKVVQGFHDLIAEEIPQSKLSMFYEVLDSVNETIGMYKIQNQKK
jgi:DNA-binding MarR family transcriptional regulator